MRISARLATAALLSLATLSLAAATSTAQQEEPKNLKVLPKTISRRELEDIMRGFSQGLGVRCDGCHAQAAAGTGRPGELDFASDDKEEKVTARKMMKMVASINDQIGQMGLKDVPKVGCVTCHHGVKSPETLAAVLTRTVQKDGVSATSDLYRKMRDQYYGTAAYDFSPASLNEVARGLAESKQDYDGALQLLKLNLEFSPNDANTYVTMALVQSGKGDKAGATASLEKALSIDPNNRRAKQMLDRMKSGQ